MAKQPKKKMNAFAKNKVSGWLFSYAFLAYPLLLFLVFYVYMNLNSFVLAFQHINLDGTREFVGMDNVREFWNGVMKAGLIKISFWNSIWRYLLVHVVSIPLAIVWSWLLFRKFPGCSVVRLIVMVPAIVGSFVYSLVFKMFAGEPFQQVMQAIGFDKFPNVMESSKYVFGTTTFYSIWTSFATSLIIYPNAMRSIDPAIFESAKIDGMHTMRQELWYIVLPLIYPTLTTFLVTGFSAIFSDSGPLVAFYMYSAPAETYTIGYMMTVQVFSDASSTANLPKVAAAGLVLTVIIGPLTLLLRWALDKLSPMED